MRVLVIDDSSFSRRVLSGLFQQVLPGCTVVGADCGANALELLRHEEPFELLTLDFHMPGIDGLALAEQLRAQHLGGKLALVTANVQSNIKARARELGLEFVGKPVNEAKIARLLGVTIPKRVHLTESDMDTILEFFNIGVGVAGASLSEMSGQEVKLSLPSLEVITKRELLKRDARQLSVIHQEFQGPFGSGRAVLTFPQDKGLKLACDLTGEDPNVDTPEMRRLADEALTEVGNTVLNACIGSLSNMAQEEFEVSLTSFEQGPNSYAHVLEQTDNEQVVLILSIRFDLQDRAIEGRMLFLVELDRLRPFIRMLEASLTG